ncbi:hypothetical protein Taro_041168 [Colocasia esculenta]|uniref:Retrotransposon gag domain-containing protein n=1 Tax=Colocasia esculenta TaxID=4460 RepID=A0A843WSN0_COLES|nr:hypothetical protein [Colocasia esculenta]
MAVVAEGVVNDGGRGRVGCRRRRWWSRESWLMTTADLGVNDDGGARGLENDSGFGDDGGKGSMVRVFRVNSKSLMSEGQAAVDRHLTSVDRLAFLNSGITGTVCGCRQPPCCCRQIHTEPANLSSVCSHLSKAPSWLSTATALPWISTLFHAMVSRGRRGAQLRKDEHRCEERGEQQAPAPHGPKVLPPPPPVDYSVFMQGLVQAQAQVPVPQEHGHGGSSIMERFKRMATPSLKGESQPLLAESWMREVEKMFQAIRCVEEDKVSLATYMLQERADVQWASVLHTRYEDGAIEVTWAEFMRLFRAKFIPEHIQDKMEQ